MEGEAEEDNIEAKEGETMHHVNEFFFRTDPDQLIYTHLPDSPKWQLLDENTRYKSSKTMCMSESVFLTWGSPWLKAVREIVF